MFSRSKVFLLLATLVAAASVAVAAGDDGVTVNKDGSIVKLAGELRGTWDGQEFEVYSTSQQISVKFVWPSSSSFSVKVFGVTGSELGDFKLSEGDTIDLTGGGKFKVVVYSSSGGGAWTAEYDDAGGPTDAAKTPETKKAGKTVTLSGTLRGTWDGNEVGLYTENPAVSVTFQWPTEMELWVKVLGVSGTELGEFDLAEGAAIDLTGGGKFKLIVYSKNGGGDWTGTYEE